VGRDPRLYPGTLPCGSWEWCFQKHDRCYSAHK